MSPSRASTRSTRASSPDPNPNANPNPNPNPNHIYTAQVNARLVLEALGRVARAPGGTLAAGCSPHDGGGGGGAPVGGGGLAILLSVHQPSHLLLQMMRGLVVMAPGGRLLYGGPRLLRGGKPTPSNACTPARLHACTPHVRVSRLQPPRARGGCDITHVSRLQPDGTRLQPQLPGLQPDGSSLQPYNPATMQPCNPARPGGCALSALFDAGCVGGVPPLRSFSPNPAEAMLEAVADPAPAVAAHVEALLARPACDKFVLSPRPPPRRDAPPTPCRASPLAELRALSARHLRLAYRAAGLQ